MSEFNIRSDSVNVEQIMQQIRARVREKRGVDYTEQQIRELAAVKLERFLDPQKVRSELLQQFRAGGISPLPNYAFEDTSLFESRYGILRFFRKLLRPVLKLFVNVNQLIHVLHLQAEINTRHAQYTELSYEILHNLVLETTRLGIEAKNLKMRVESLSSRLDFSERRARALEGVVQYKAGDAPEAEAAPPAAGEAGPRDAQREGAPAAGPADARRKRRRRRGRRGGGRGPEEAAAAGGGGEAPADSEADGSPGGEGVDTGGAQEPEHREPEGDLAGTTGTLPWRDGDPGAGRDEP